MENNAWSILFIEDDEEDYLLILALLMEAKRGQFELRWASTVAQAIEQASVQLPDAILLDYNLGVENGLDVARRLLKEGCNAPIIFLTGYDDYQLDVEAMKAGVSDFLPKNELTAPLLERSIRYAIDHRQSEEALRDARDKLALRVEERTQALASTISELEREANERRRVEEALRKSEARFRAVFEQSDIGIQLLDLKGRILSANPAFQHMLGYTTGELRRMPYLEFTDPVDSEVSQAFFTQLVSGEIDRIRLENRYRHKDGRTVWGVQTVSMVRTRAGDPKFAIAIVENITEQKRMEIELAELQGRLMDSIEVEKLQIAQRLHDDAIQDLSAAIFQVESLRDGLSSEEQELQLNDTQAVLRQVIQTLRTTYQELHPPALIPYGIDKAIRSHAEGFALEHPEISVSLNISHHNTRDLPERIAFILYRIYQQAMFNVARHAHATRVAIRLRRQDGNLMLEVEDNGSGFSVPESWIDQVRSGHYGLAGATERVKAVGGTLRVASDRMRGTLVHVSVPEQPVEVPA